MLLRRVLRRRLVRVSIQTEVLRRVLRRGCVTEGAQKVLRRQKHALSQSTTPFARRKPKGDGGKGTGKKKGHDYLRHFATFYDNFRLC